VVAGVSLLVLYPWLSIEPGERLRPKDPFGIILNVSNEGYLPLRDISIACNFDLTDIRENTLKNVSVSFDHFQESLSYKRKLSLPCFRAAKIEVPLKQVSLRVFVSYNIWKLPGRRTQQFSLIGEAGSEQNWHWLFRD
jgi:hypothetical protein